MSMTFPPKLRVEDRVNGGPDSKSVGELQAALRKLKLNVDRSELARKELGPSTTEALRAFQERSDLAPEGKPTTETVARLNVELEHAFVANSKTRTRRLQEMLQRVEIPVDASEVQNRVFGRSTERAVKRYQDRAGLSRDGKVTEELFNRLREDALQARLGKKTQVARVHRTLLRALNIAKLDARVDAEELKGKEIGPSTKDAIKAVQQKYGLPETGELDADTYDRLVSIPAIPTHNSSRTEPRTR